MLQVRAGTRILALLGDPVGHSLSPEMYNAAFGVLGVNAVYVALPTKAASLAHVMRAFESLGIAGNVTLPHKVDVASLLIKLTTRAKEVGAVNTFWPSGERLMGDNTDVPGVIEALDTLEAGEPWLLAGTGGTARAVIAAAKERAVPVLVRSRSEIRAREFAAWGREEVGADVHADDGRSVSTAINSTPLGLNPNDPPPFSAERLDGGQVALDLVYRPGETRWVKTCREMGLRAADGRVMLVGQGMHSFRRFFPDLEPPREVMVAAVNRALES